MSMPSVAVSPALRIGARVLLLDHADRALLIRACDPDDPGHHWWELPGGGVDPGETLADTAIREVAEETGIVLDALGPCVRPTRVDSRDPVPLPAPRPPPSRARLHQNSPSRCWESAL